MRLTCPRCNGRVFISGDERYCLPCGWVQPPANVLPLVQEMWRAYERPGQRKGPRLPGSGTGGRT